jgi:hypothetical protein
MVHSAPSNDLGVGVDFVRVKPEHLSGVRAVVHQPALRVAHVVLTG